MAVFGRARENAAGSLAEVRQAFARETAARDQAAAAAETTRLRADAVKADAAADLGLGRISEAEYDERAAAAEVRLAEARAATVRHDAVLEALAERGLKIAADEEAARLRRLDADDAELAAEEGNVRAALARVGRQRATVAAARRAVQHETASARAEFSPKEREALAVRRRQAHEAARSRFANFPSERRAAAAAGNPVALAMERADAEHRERTHEQADESWRALGLPGQPYPRA